MSEELIVFTHSDLDALGCMLNIEYKWPNVQKKYFHTNYANIVSIVPEIIDYAKQNNCTRILIPDVSFSDNKDSLRVLYNFFERVVHIDHHMYPNGFWDEFPNMKVVYDKTKSATLLTNEYLGNAGLHRGLDQLTHIIDVYDIWQKDKPVFNVSQDFNEYFWYKVKGSSIEILMREIIDRDYNLPTDYRGVINLIKQQYNDAILDFENRKLIHRGGDITFAFINEWFNQIMLKEHERGTNFVIGITSFGIVRIRINQDCPYSVQQLNEIRLQLTGNSEYGHLHAFTYKINNSLDNIMNEAQKIANVITSVCKK